MAHFYGTVEGNAKTHASRRGTKESGLEVTAAGWDIGTRTILRYDKPSDTDYVLVYLTRGSNGYGKGKLIGKYKRVGDEIVLLDTDLPEGLL